MRNFNETSLIATGTAKFSFFFHLAMTDHGKLIMELAETNKQKTKKHKETTFSKKLINTCRNKFSKIWLQKITMKFAIMISLVFLSKEQHFPEVLKYNLYIQ